MVLEQLIGGLSRAQTFENALSHSGRSADFSLVDGLRAPLLAGLIDRRGLFTRFAPPREGSRDPGEQAAQPKLSGIMPVQNVDNHSG